MEILTILGLDYRDVSLITKIPCGIFESLFQQSEISF